MKTKKYSIEKVFKEQNKKIFYRKSFKKNIYNENKKQKTKNIFKR